MTQTYQAEHFTGAQLDYFMKKVNSGEIAGRGLEIDAEGNLNCSVPGYSKLIYSYTHTGNPEVHPTDLDITTGIFTAPAHGIDGFTATYVVVHPPYYIGEPVSYLPGGMVLGEVTTTGRAQAYYFNVIDEDHFALTASVSSSEYLTFTENENMDFSKFHFEMPNLQGQELVIEGLDVQECLLVVKGRMHSNFKRVHPTNRMDFGNCTGAVGYDAGFGSDQYGSCYFGRPGYNYFYGVVEFKMLGDRHAYQVNNVDYVMYAADGKAKFYHNRQYFHMRLTSNEIEGLYLGGDQKGALYNGSTLEVYAK